MGLEAKGKGRVHRFVMNRIVERFANLRKAEQKGLVVYIGAGDPDLEATRQLALAFDQAGVDVLELGVPFSDPLADGVVNQLAAQRGLASGTTPKKVLETVARSDTIESEWVARRPIPDTDAWFETAWAAHREGRIYG